MNKSHIHVDIQGARGDAYELQVCSFYHFGFLHGLVVEVGVSVRTNDDSKYVSRIRNQMAKHSLDSNNTHYASPVFEHSD